MFRSWRVTWSAHTFAPFYDAPDAAGGGGGTDPAEGGDGGTPSGDDLDAAAGDPAADGSDDDDDDDPDITSPDPVTPERWQRVVKKLNKLNRRDRNTAPLRQREKELKARGLSIDDLVTAHTNYAHLNQTIQRNAKLRALLYGEAEPAEPEPAARRPAGKTVDEDAFDESALPFDPNENETNRYFAGLAKSNHELSKLVRQLEARVNGVDQRDTQRTEASVKAEWNRAFNAAAVHIKDEGVRTLFQDAVTAAYHNRTQHRKSPQDIVAHYLMKLKVDPKQADKANAAVQKTAPAAPGTRATAATQQRIAEQNKTLPRTVAPGGTPAPARTNRESVTEVGKRIRQQLRA